jgi:serine O-acetyltransferase
MNKIKKIIKNSIFLYCLIKLTMYILSVLLDFPKHILGTIYSIAFYKTWKVYYLNHLTIGIKELISKKTTFPHPIGIVIGAYVKIGNNCQIYQNVTIGSKDKFANKEQYPKIGDNVIIYANSVLIGNIIIGNNAIIGAGSIVTTSIPDNSIAAGNPCRVIKMINGESTNSKTMGFK